MTTENGRTGYGRIIILEGNISAGKSSLCEGLKKSDASMKAFFEPTLTNPYLESFYADPPRYALKMQMWLFRQRYLTYMDALRYVLETGNDAILDRSVYSDWVFAEKNLMDGNITLEGYQYYMALRHHLLAELPLPHFTVYLRVAPDVCYDRIHNLRQRNCESTIPLEYLQGLHECYDKLLNELNQRGSQVLSFDWTAFGSADEVMKQLGRYKFESTQLQWDRVRVLLDQLERIDLHGHMWPEHLSEQASLFDEPDATHTSSTMENEAFVLALDKSKTSSDEEDSPVLISKISGGGKRVNLAPTLSIA